MKSRRTRAPSRAAWERGYDGHIYRDPLGNELGRVTRVGKPVYLYDWSTQGCRGSEKSLPGAKRLVEDAVRRNIRQGELFQEGNHA